MKFGKMLVLISMRLMIGLRNIHTFSFVSSRAMGILRAIEIPQASGTASRYRCQNSKIPASDRNNCGEIDKEDSFIKPALETFIQNSTVQTVTSDIIPGKGSPPETPVCCCMSGCANCVWIQYTEELKRYYRIELGTEKARTAIEKIENPGLQMFLKLELGLL